VSRASLIVAWEKSSDEKSWINESIGWERLECGDRRGWDSEKVHCLGGGSSFSKQLDEHRCSVLGEGGKIAWSSPYSRTLIVSSIKYALA
jgi:hypothetical protein